jgi:hypothetical protein
MPSPVPVDRLGRVGAATNAKQDGELAPLPERSIATYCSPRYTETDVVARETSRSYLDIDYQHSGETGNTRDSKQPVWRDGGNGHELMDEDDPPSLSPSESSDGDDAMNDDFEEMVEKEKWQRRTTSKLRSLKARNLRARCKKTVAAGELIAFADSNQVSCRLGGGDIPKDWPVVHPDSNARLAWDLSALFASVYDGVMVPFDLAYDLKFQGIIALFTWTVSLFWLTDLFAGFVFGFYLRGVPVLKTRAIVSRYLRRDFAFNLLVVLADWVVLYLAHSEVDSPIACAKLLRLTRLPRGLRAIRNVYALSGLPARLTAGRCFHICVKLVQFVAFILWLMHALACVWTVVGHQDYSHYDRMGISADRSDLLLDYVMSFYWSSNAVIGGHGQVQPISATEVFITALAMIVGLISCSIIVPIVTDALTQLRASQEEQSRLLRSLRVYLKQFPGLPWRTAREIERMAIGRPSDEEGRVLEHDVELLKNLTPYMKVRLQTAVFCPAVSCQSFIRACESRSDVVVQNICTHALDQVILPPGGVSFNRGDKSDGAYFVFWGAFDYLQRFKEDEPVERRRWHCELALFCVWQFEGSLRARSAGELLKIGGDEFAAVLEQDEKLRDLAQDYARGLCMAVKKSPVHSELMLPVRHEDVLRFMQKSKREAMSDAALQLMKTKRAKSINGLTTHGEHTEGVNGHSYEVNGGDADLVVQGTLKSWSDPIDEEVLRVQSAAVLKVKNGLGQVLMEVGRHARGGGAEMWSKARLPETNLLAGEMPCDAAHRLLGERMPLLRGVVQMMPGYKEVEEEKFLDDGARGVGHLRIRHSCCGFVQDHAPPGRQVEGLSSAAFALERVERAADPPGIFAWLFERDVPTFQPQTLTTPTLTN